MAQRESTLAAACPNQFSHAKKSAKTGGIREGEARHLWGGMSQQKVPLELCEGERG